MGWTVRGSNLGGGEIFGICPDRPWGPPSLLYNGYRVFPGGKERPGRDADPSPPSRAVAMKGYSYTCIPPMGRTACTGCTLPYSTLHANAAGTWAGLTSQDRDEWRVVVNTVMNLRVSYSARKSD